MKKIFLLVATFTMTSMLMAQKGTWYVGGNVGFSSSQNKSEMNGVSSDDDKVTSWTFSPEVGTFLTDNWQLGIGLSIGGSKQDPTNVNSTSTKNTFFGGTVYSRYFFGNKAFRPFLGANIKALPGTTTGITNSSETKSNYFELGANLNAGFGYAISNKVSVLGSLGVLGFSHQTSKIKGGDYKVTNNTFSFNANTLGNPFTIGMYFTL